MSINLGDEAAVMEQKVAYHTVACGEKLVRGVLRHILEEKRRKESSMNKYDHLQKLIESKGRMTQMYIESSLVKGITKGAKVARIPIALFKEQSGRYKILFHEEDSKKLCKLIDRLNRMSINELSDKKDKKLSHTKHKEFEL